MANTSYAHARSETPPPCEQGTRLWCQVAARLLPRPSTREGRGGRLSGLRWSRSLALAMRRSLDRSTRRLLDCGAVAGPVLAATFLIEGSRRRDYDPRRHPVSSLALGPGGWRQTAKLFGCWLSVSHQCGGPSARISCNRWDRAGPVLVGTAAVGLIGAQCRVDNRANRCSYDEVWGESDLGECLQHADLNCAEACPAAEHEPDRTRQRERLAARKGWFRDQRSYRRTTNRCRLGARVSGTAGRATSSELSLEVGTVESLP